MVLLAPPGVAPPVSVRLEISGKRAEAVANLIPLLVTPFAPVGHGGCRRELSVANDSELISLWAVVVRYTSWSATATMECQLIVWGTLPSQQMLMDMAGTAMVGLGTPAIKIVSKSCVKSRQDRHHVAAPGSVMHNYQSRKLSNKPE